MTTNRDGTVNCSDIIMSNGLEHIKGGIKCALCGKNGRMKVGCSEEGCRAWGQRKGPYRMHVTCAREAGLEVKDKTGSDGHFFFDTKCFRHSGSDFVFRARCEDLIEVERRRAGKCFERVDFVMSLAHASRLYNKSIVVMKMLGWAWRWAEWWVEYGDNWEPLLEPGEKEENMSKEELKIVDSTRESRCEAARKCRLAALGAALRNRDYDKEEGDDRVALDRALRALLHTRELVGPLEPYEVDFFAEWLGRAYRSKSRLLGFGDDKIPTKDTVGTLHVDDMTPKYVLGSRRLPGKQELPDGTVFETDFNDVDDFLKPETYEDGSLVTPESLVIPKKKRAHSALISESSTLISESKQSSKKLKKRGTMSLFGSIESTASAGGGNEMTASDEGAASVSEVALSNTPKRIGRPPKTPDGKEMSTLKRKGEARRTPDKKAISTPKRKGQPLCALVGEAVSTPKRRGRKPKSSKPPDTTPSTDANFAHQPDDEHAVVQLEVGIGIAERTKKRRSSPEAPPVVPTKRKNIRRKLVEEKELDGSASSPDAEARSVASLEGATDDDDITIASYVKQWKRSQGETPSTKHAESESSDDSSQSEPEIPLLEMTPTQRGRKRGKRIAMSMLWR